MTEDKKNKLKAEQALKIAKSIKRKVILVPKGITGDLLAGKTKCQTTETRKSKE